MLPARLLLILSLLLGGARARAEERHVERLPPDKLVTLAPLLRDADLALVESQPDGHMRQVTLFVWVAAPPQLVREVVANLEKYPEFIRNMSKSKVTRNPDGTVDQEWAVDLLVNKFGGLNRNYFRPDGAIEVEAIDENNDATYRWEFHPAAGGTVLVQYGYVDVLHSNAFIRSVVTRMPPMEHGLALAAQLVYIRSVKQRAERLAPRQPAALTPPAGAGKTPSFNFLLDRGRVAVIRSLPSGHLETFSLVGRVAASRERLEGVIFNPDAYASFVPGISQSQLLERGDHRMSYRATFTLPALSWNARWTGQSDGRGGIDVLGVEGDLRGAYMRWDLTALGAQRTLAVLRARLDLGMSSFLLRQLFLKEPYFEHGLNVAFGLVMLSSMGKQAESEVVAVPPPAVDAAPPSAVDAGSRS